MKHILNFYANLFNGNLLIEYSKHLRGEENKLNKLENLIK